MAQPSAPPVVLVADDEPQMLELVARHLKSLDVPRLEVIEASDGDEAWRLAQETLPDLVVLDVMMPGMSGWEVCRKIREEVALAHTGVVMLTGIGESLNEMTSPLYGADAHIDKPFDFEELDKKVKETLDARASQRSLAPRPSPSKNGVGGPAQPAKRRAAAKKKTTQKKQSPTGARKGKIKMAAKKAAKKSAAKTAKKPAKKAAKKAAKKGAKK